MRLLRTSQDRPPLVALGCRRRLCRIMRVHTRDAAPANSLVQVLEPALGEECPPERDLANPSLVLVIESVEAIGIVHQLQHLGLDAVLRAARSHGPGPEDPPARQASPE
jgi:hypothetical protein